MTTWKVRALIVVAAIWCNSAWAQTDAVQSLDVRIPLAPQPVTVGDDVQLFYELHLINFASSPVTLTDVDVLDADSKNSLARFEGDALAALFGQSGVAKDAEPRSLAPGMHGVIYMTLPLRRATPGKLSHRITLSVASAAGPRTAVVNTDVTPIDKTPLLELGPPLRGGQWAALYDPAMERGHRRVLYAVDGHAHLPGRFAMDFFGVDDAGKTHNNAGERPADYFGYGVDVLAVANGTVIAARDDFTEPATLAAAPERLRLGDGTGVYVALDIGNGRFAFYEHLQPGLAVKVGQKVRRGDRLGAVGFTGQAMSPHLHFHVANATAPLAAEGMPYHFTSYRVRGQYDSIMDFGDKPWKALPATKVATQSLPAANVVISFD